MAEPIQIIALPAPPAALPADTYAVRHRVWWEQCDTILRTNDQNLRVWQSTLSEQVADRSTAAQHARAVAEENVAKAGKDAAAAQTAAAQALNAPQPLPSDAALLLSFYQTLLAAGVGSSAMAVAKARLADFKAATAPIFQAP